ncbi:hypothetical protein RDI58_017726 [Solanum bulbocastanum]|uniref:Uncharacterized protein n=1 Tax=Solanum bulbocastanum TaxID=147425 RepID=A0AAN8Y9G5_SOLBU
MTSVGSFESSFTLNVKEPIFYICIHEVPKEFQESTNEIWHLLFYLMQQHQVHLKSFIVVAMKASMIVKDTTPTQHVRVAF